MIRARKLGAVWVVFLAALAVGAVAPACSSEGGTTEDPVGQTDSIGLAFQAAPNASADATQRNTLALVGTAVAPSKASATSAVVAVPDSVEPDDLAVVVVLTTGTTTLASSPAGFTTGSLAASNHRLSYGLVGTAHSLTWTTSSAATTGATAYFFRGKALTVRSVSSGSKTSASFGLAATTTAGGSATSSLAYGLYGLQLGLSNPPTMTAGAGGAWTYPLTDGKQLFTWSQPLVETTPSNFAFPVSSGTLSASATFRQAQVIVQAPAELAGGSGESSGVGGASGGGATGGTAGTTGATGGTAGTGGGAGRAGAGAGGSASAQTRPNVLLIIADDLGAEATSVYPELAGKSGAVSLPNIEALAANGLVFDNAWASPVCSPTRSTIVSGLYGNRTGVLYVGNVLPTSTVTLFDRLTAESSTYDQAFFGKYHLGTSVQHVRDLGIPRFRGFTGGGVDDYYNWNALDLNGTSQNYRTWTPSVLTDFALDFIGNHKATRPNDPWFIYQAYNAPHFPNQVPPANLHSVPLGGLQQGQVSDTVPNYKAMIQSLDTEIGRLLSKVDLSNTVVIFIGDNGTPANVKDSGARVRGSKSSVYEGGVRVPFIVSGAGVTRRGREPALVVSSDLYATILGLAGVPVSHVNDSYNVKPLLTDASAKSGRTHSFTEICNGTQRLYAIRDQRYKLLSNTGQWALYDLATDPLEATNLYANGDYAAVRSGLESALAQVKANATSGCFN